MSIHRVSTAICALSCAAVLLLSDTLSDNSHGQDAEPRPDGSPSQRIRDTPPSAAQQQLPRVLIIGDSISLGYTPHVVEMLRGQAVVQHSPGNSQHTGTGLSKLKTWLGEETWDVIHFNWGLWDLCYRNPEAKTQGNRDKLQGKLTTPLETYEQNLSELTRRLRTTGSTLIWAHTTTVPKDEVGRIEGDEDRYNAIATRVMQEYGVTVNDLNTLTDTFPAELFTKPGDVHYTPDGYKRIARQVADHILAALNTDAERGESQAGKPLQHILFGSCVRQDKPMPIFEQVVAESPELFLFLGDNIYGDSEDLDVLSAKYGLLSADTGFQKLRATCPLLATWDDHDYGVNDGGADYPQREGSQRLFVDFWNDSADSIRRKRPGVYDSSVYGQPGQRVQIILLDTRYFRSPLKTGERRTGGPYVPDGTEEKTMLGQAQWQWLEEQLRQPAEIRIVATSIQCVSEDDGHETWSNLPRERARFFALLKSTGANGVVLISGDRHWSELSVEREAGAYPVYELTSSSLNQPHPRGTPTRNRFRAIPVTWHQENYGVVDIDWSQPDPQITLCIRDAGGETRLQHRVKLSDLQVK